MEMLDNEYDFLIVGAGLFGSVFACEASRRGYRCLVIDRRKHIGGNVYTEKIEGINVHKYGPHIFHTSDSEVWDYMRQFAEFNDYINAPIAVYNDAVYNLPFNMNTFSRMWGVKSPAEAKAIIDKQIAESGITNPANLEEQAISLVGRDIYETLIKGYTEKQWGRSCKDLPGSIISRIPLRFTYNNNYFTDKYQGIPIGGYTSIIQKMLYNCDVMLDTDYFEFRKTNPHIAKKTVYTGMIDEFYDYQFGVLEYRSLRFETAVMPCGNYQGNAVINYTSSDIPYTRIIEHKHFEPKNIAYADIASTIITREYPIPRTKGCEPYYPVEDKANKDLYDRYKALAEKDSDVIFGGRLGYYKYYDMDDIVAKALEAANQCFGF